MSSEAIRAPSEAIRCHQRQSHLEELECTTCRRRRCTHHDRSLGLHTWAWRDESAVPGERLEQQLSVPDEGGNQHQLAPISAHHGQSSIRSTQLAIT